jgi:exodeoxyribonuclease VII large subunit
VIRDILHRIRDRWPCRVLVWPVVVQGEAAAAQIAAAISGFNALEPAGAIPRPDVLIVARGGGSVEDLWPFNDEALARAAGASAIPLISAVGHETDTTLIDFVADVRAPTPTAAAEIATPVLAELRAAVSDGQARLIRAMQRLGESLRARLLAAGRGLPRPSDILALARQRFDLAAGRLGAALDKNASAHERDLVRVAGRLSPGLLERPRQAKAQRLAEVWRRAAPAAERRLLRAGEAMASLERQRIALSPMGPLKRGFAIVRHAGGAVARHAADLAPGEAVQLVFEDAARGAVVDGEARAPVRKTAKPAAAGQGDLF